MSINFRTTYYALRKHVIGESEDSLNDRLERLARVCGGFAGGFRRGDGSLLVAAINECEHGGLTSA